MLATRVMVGLLVILGVAAFILPPNAQLSESAPVSDPQGQQGSLLQQAALLQTTPTPEPQPTATPNLATAAPAGPELVVWWPAELMPVAESPAEDTLLTVLEAYRSENDLSLQFRVKRLTGAGSIMSTLRTASDVAPGALPDVVLLSRAALLEAAASGLAYPLESSASATISRNVYTRALALGQYEETPYGIPYTLTVQHAAYPENAFTTSPDTFRALSESEVPFAFALGIDSGTGTTSLTSAALLIQYSGAGGRLVDENGSPVIDEIPLRDVLRFYTEALANAQIDANILNYTNQQATWEALVNGSVSFAQVDSNTYLHRQAEHPEIHAGILPTEGGSALTTLDGWLLVITTPDPARQAAAEDFITWMMHIENQGALTQALQTLPSQRLTLQSWAGTDYVALIDRLLGNTRAILPEQVTASVAEGLQTALASVITGEESADEAARLAAQRVNR